MNKASLRDDARGLFVQWQVVHALILRETRTRFGAHQLGYLWALLGPISTIATFGVMMFVLGKTAPLGDDIVTFLATGFLPFMFFRSVTSSGAVAIGANKALLFYPQVHPLDLILARAGLETATLGVVFVSILGTTALWKQTLVVDNLLNVLMGLLLAGGLGAGLGLVLCAASVFSKVIEKVANLVLRPIFWVSGVFFTANDLPPAARELILYNPVLHCTEMVRDGWYTSYSARYINIMYPLCWCIGLVFVGLTLERVARRRVSFS